MRLVREGGIIIAMLFGLLLIMSGVMITFMYNVTHMQELVAQLEQHEKRFLAMEGLLVMGVCLYEKQKESIILPYMTTIPEYPCTDLSEYSGEIHIQNNGKNVTISCQVLFNGTSVCSGDYNLPK